MLTAHQITYAAGGKTILEGVTLAFNPGQIHLIIGPNGAGKSTLVKILSGQVRPQEGEVQYAGRPISEMDVSQLAKIRAVLSQHMELAFPMPVDEVVMMGRYPHFTSRPSSADYAICEEAMRYFDVLEMHKRNYLTLSGGEKQRVHFARVLSQVWGSADDGIRMVLLDEPLTFLDVYYQMDFMEKLVALARTQQLIVAGVVHDLQLAGKYADHLVLLHLGRVIASGEKKAVLTKELIQKAYRLEAEIQYEGQQVRVYF